MGRGARALAIAHSLLHKTIQGIVRCASPPAKVAASDLSNRVWPHRHSALERIFMWRCQVSAALKGGGIHARETCDIIIGVHGRMRADLHANGASQWRSWVWACRLGLGEAASSASGRGASALNIRSTEFADAPMSSVVARACIALRSRLPVASRGPRPRRPWTRPRRLRCRRRRRSVARPRRGRWPWCRRSGRRGWTSTAPRARAHGGPRHGAWDSEV